MKKQIAIRNQSKAIGIICAFVVVTCLYAAFRSYRAHAETKVDQAVVNQMHDILEPLLRNDEALRAQFGNFLRFEPLQFRRTQFFDVDRIDFGGDVWFDKQLLRVEGEISPRPDFPPGEGEIYIHSWRVGPEHWLAGKSYKVLYIHLARSYPGMPPLTAPKLLK